MKQLLYFVLAQNIKVWSDETRPPEYRIYYPAKGPLLKQLNIYFTLLLHYTTYIYHWQFNIIIFKIYVYRICADGMFV